MDQFSGAIGVLGGVGPYAGLDLMRKVFDHTVACCDQEHLPVIQYSLSGHIADRTAFLLGKSTVNPGEAMGAIMVGLAKSGATVIGIPCNTAHSPSILDPARKALEAAAPNVRFVHMIDEVVQAIRTSYPEVRKVGVLSTIGTWQTGIYQNTLEAGGLEPIFPDESGRENVQQAISHTEYGIKAQSNPVTEKARAALAAEAGRLVQAGAQVVILGCTEIPLALTEERLHGVPLIDATTVLAKALILAFAPEKLRR